MNRLPGENIVVSMRVMPSIQQGNLKASNTIRVDRGTPWGNPFVIHTNNDVERNRVCDLYELYAVWRLTVEPDWLEPLRGHDLACWCAPKRCHADTLLRLANRKDPLAL